MPTAPVVYLGLDQGSGASKGVIIDAAGSVIAEFSRPVTTNFLDETRVEQSPEELHNSLKSIIAESQAEAVRRGCVIGACGLALQRSGVTAWRNGRSLAPLLCWRDTRGRSIIDGIAVHHDLITRLTTLPPSPHYAATKIAIVQQQFPDPSIRVGTLDSFLLDSLIEGGVFRTEEGMASRTMLYDLVEGRWSTDLASVFQLDSSRLAEIFPSLGFYGDCDGIPLTCLMGDQQAALLGRPASSGSSIVNLGTISSVSVETGIKLPRIPGFITNVMYSKVGVHGGRERQFFIEGVTNSSGQVFDYLLKKKPCAVSLDDLDQRIQERSGESSVAFYGIGGTATPWWRSDVGIVADSAITDDISRARMMVEHCGFSVARNMLTLRDSGLIHGSHVAVAGGYSRCHYLCQIIADVSGLELRSYASREATALGAARGAILGSGSTLPSSTEEVPTELFVPQNSPARERFNRWKDLESRVLSGQRRSLDVEVKL